MRMRMKTKTDLSVHRRGGIAHLEIVSVLKMAENKDVRKRMAKRTSPRRSLSGRTAN